MLKLVFDALLPAVWNPIHREKFVSSKNEHWIYWALGLPVLSSGFSNLSDLFHFSTGEFSAKRCKNQERPLELLCDMSHARKILLLKFAVSLTLSERNSALFFAVDRIAPKESEIRFY